MTPMLPHTRSPQVFYLEGQPITVKNTKQLHPRRATVHRVELETGSFRYNIPPSVTTVIIKQQKDGWENELQVEKKAYERLKGLQGEVIPQLYGQGTFNGLPSLILSDIAGVNLHDFAHNRNEFQEITFQLLEEMLTESLRKLYEQGAEHWDQKLDNFLFCDYKGGKVMIVDLEEVSFPDQIGDWETNVNLGGVGCLMDDFKDIRDRNRETSPVRFWMTRPKNEDAVATPRVTNSSPSLDQGWTEQRQFFVHPASRSKDGTAKTNSKSKVVKEKKGASKKRGKGQWGRFRSFSCLSRNTSSG